MRATQHPSNTRVLGAPKGWDQQGELPCNALAITDASWCGIPSVISYWQPTKEEIAQIVAGKPIALSIVGTTMPPAAVYVGD